MQCFVRNRMWPSTLVNPVIFTSAPYYFMEWIALKLHFHLPPASFCLAATLSCQSNQQMLQKQKESEFVVNQVTRSPDVASAPEQRASHQDRFYLVHFFLVLCPKCDCVHHSKCLAHWTWIRKHLQWLNSMYCNWRKGIQMDRTLAH